MGQGESKYENDLEDIHQQVEDPLIRIEVSNFTPIVGVEIKPIVHLKTVGGCVFEWRRMPKVKRKLLSTSPSRLNMTDDSSSSMIGESPSDSDNQPIQRDFSLSDLKPISLPDTNRTVLHRVTASQANDDILNPITNVGVPTELRTVGSMNSFRFLPAKERKGVLVCQGVNYIPTQQDVGHPLKFSVTFIGYKHSITSYIETHPTIPLPARTPPRKWLMPAQEIEATSPKDLVHPYYDSTFSSKFAIMSYNITGRRLVQLLKAKQSINNRDKQQRELADSIYSNCPDYVFTDVYRKKLLLREILSYNSDIIALQSIHEQLYNEWHIELSKSGYSGVFKTTYTNVSSTGPRVVKNADNPEIDYSAEEKLGACILYRRGKFNKTKEWLVKLEYDADVTSLLNKLSTEQCINSTEKDNILNECRANRNFGIVCELEFKDMYEIMQKLQKKQPTLDFSQVVLLFATVNIYQQQGSNTKQLTPLEKEIISLIQVHLLLRKIEAIIKDESYAQKGSKVALSIAGDLDCDSSSLAYEYLAMYSKQNPSFINEGDDDDLDTSPSVSTAQSDEEEVDGMLLPDTEVTVPQQQASETLDLNELSIYNMSSVLHNKILAQFEHEYKLLNSFRQATSREMKYTLSDRTLTTVNATDFIFYSADELKVVRVAEEPANRSFPNIYFSSDHVAVISELDLNVLSDQTDLTRMRKTQSTTSGSEAAKISYVSTSEKIIS